MIVNLGLQLTAAQSYLLVFPLLAVFSLSFSFASQAENMMLQSSRPTAHLERPRGGKILMNSQKVAIYAEEEVLRWIYIQVRVLIKGGGGGASGIFIFPIMHLQQDSNWH